MKRNQWDRFSHEMAVVVSMLIVKTNHTAVIIRVKLVIDVSEIIPDNIALFVLPDFTT